MREALIPEGDGTWKRLESGFVSWGLTFGKGVVEPGRGEPMHKSLHQFLSCRVERWGGGIGECPSSRSSLGFVCFPCFFLPGEERPEGHHP